MMWQSKNKTAKSYGSTGVVLTKILLSPITKHRGEFSEARNKVTHTSLRFTMTHLNFHEITTFFFVMFCMGN